MFKILINNIEQPYERIKFTEKFNSLSNELNVGFIDEYTFNYNDKIKLMYNNDVLLNGYIDNINISKNSSSIITNIDCRDITGDIIDSTMRVITRKKKYNFITLIKEITGLEVINTSNVINFTIPYEVKSSIGQSMADFLQQIAKYFKVFLSCSSDGKILITSLNTNTSNIVKIDDYISYNKSFSIQNLFNRYTCYGQTDIDDNSLIAGQIVDNNIRNSRFYVFESETTLETTLQARDLSDRRRQLNKASAENINITLPFLNKIIKVNNYATFKNMIYFIDEVVYNVSSSNKTIDIKLVDKNVYL